MEVPSHYTCAAIPHIMLDGAAEAIEYYADAFGASELFRLGGDDGRIVHAEISVQGSTIMLGDAQAPFSAPGLDGACVALHVYVPDVDALTARAVAADAELRTRLLGRVVHAGVAQLRSSAPCWPATGKPAST